MSTTASKLRGECVPHDLREVAVKVNAGTAALIDINAANISLAEKEALRRLRTGSQTRADLNALPVDLPLKRAAHDIAGT